MPRLLAATALLLLLPGIATAQDPERVSFEAAVSRALEAHPSVQQAAVGVTRAQAVLRQVSARSRPFLNATFTTAVNSPATEFAGERIVPRAQTLSVAELGVPLFTPVSWAERSQAADQVAVSERGLADARRAIALATGQAYLAVIAGRRIVELNERALETARAHADYANRRFQGGLGSRLNALRAQQEVSSAEARVEEARLAVRRTQEALGVLTGSDGAVDAASEPSFPAPQEGTSDAALVQARRDVVLVAAQQRAAERVLADSWKDRLPSATALVSPQMLAPAGLFADPRSWRASFAVSVPLFDAGQRQGRELERRTLVSSVRLEREDVERRAASEIRSAREAVGATERAAEHARLAAQQANEVLSITDLAFREGATTNIEVVDAQRRARDADTAAVMAEDAVRQARLELLAATGRFPSP